MQAISYPTHMSKFNRMVSTHLAESYMFQAIYFIQILRWFLYPHWSSFNWLNVCSLFLFTAFLEELG